jgi:hypothetical protein
VGNEKKQTGRPREKTEAKRSAIAVRTTPDVKARLVEAAKKSGRSLTQEIELRLERSVEAEDHAGGPATAALVQAIIADIAAIEAITGKSWAEDNVTYSAVRRAVIAAVCDRPPRRVENHEEVLATLKEARAAQKTVKFGYEALNYPLLVHSFNAAADAEAFRAAVAASLPQAEEEYRKAQEAADEAYKHQIEAERLGRKLYRDLRQSQREALEARQRA